MCPEQINTARCNADHTNVEKKPIFILKSREQPIAQSRYCAFRIAFRTGIRIVDLADLKQS